MQASSQSNGPIQEGRAPADQRQRGGSGNAGTFDIDRSIPFVDAHHHLWELDRLRYDWLTEPGSPEGTANIGNYALIRSTIGNPWRLFREFYAANVIKTVHVEAAVTSPSSIEETVWLHKVNVEYGFPNALVVHADLETAGAIPELEGHLAASNLTRGVRLRAHPAAPGKQFWTNYPVLEKYQLSYELNASPGTLILGRETADRYPQIQVIVAHAGLPTQRDAAYFEQWRREMNELAKSPNIACKVSGLGMSDHTWTIASIRPWVLHCLEAFGVERVMFGTNWPVDALYGTYLAQTDAFRVVLSEAGLSRAEQEALLWRNAERLYRI